MTRTGEPEDPRCGAEAPQVATSMDSLRLRAHDCPFLARMFGCIRSGVPERDAMIQTLAALSEGRVRALRCAVDATSRRAPSVLILPRCPCGAAGPDEHHEGDARDRAAEPVR